MYCFARYFFLQTTYELRTIVNKIVNEKINAKYIFKLQIKYLVKNAKILYKYLLIYP